MANLRDVAHTAKRVAYPVVLRPLAHLKPALLPLFFDDRNLVVIETLKKSSTRPPRWAKKREKMDETRKPDPPRGVLPVHARKPICREDHR